MTKESKLIEKIESVPIRSDISVQEFNKYLEINGYFLARHDGTSHMQFKHKQTGDILTVAYHNKHVKVAYVKDAIRQIKSHKEEAI